MSRLLPARAMLVLLMAMTACAPSYFGRVTSAPNDLEAQVLADAVDRRLDSIERAAMIVGGPTTAADLDEALSAWTQKLAPVVAQTRALPETKRPAALLRALFANQVLREASSQATTLYDVLTTGRFNDVSASLVYVLAASRVGVDAKGFLLPSHARVTVQVNGAPVPVDPTKADGYDAPANGPVVYGEATDVVGLLAAVYSTIAVDAIDYDRNELAKKIAQRAENLVGLRERKLLQEQRANSLAARAFEERRSLAATLRLGSEARRLANDEALIQKIDEEVLTRVAQYAEANASSLQTKEILQLKQALEPFDLSANGHAILLEAVAVLQIERDDLSAAERTLTEALAMVRSAALREHLHAVNVYRLAKQSSKDPLGAATALSQTPFAPTDENAKNIAHNALAALAAAGRCDDQQTEQQKWTSVLSLTEREDLLAHCYTIRAEQLLATKDYPRLITELRVAVRTVQKNATIKQSLTAALNNQVAVLLDDYRCDAAKPLLIELKHLHPNDTTVTQNLRYCSQR